MPHHASSVSRVKDPAKSFGEAIRDIDDSRNMLHVNFVGFSPVLNREVLDVNVTRTLGGNAAVDHIDRRHIVNKKRCRSCLRVTEFEEYRTKVLGMLGRRDSCEKLRFCARSSCYGLRFGAVRDYTATKQEGIACR